VYTFYYGLNRANSPNIGSTFMHDHAASKRTLPYTYSVQVLCVLPRKARASLPFREPTYCMWRDSQAKLTCRCISYRLKYRILCLPTVNTTVASKTPAITPFVWEHTYYRVTATCTVYRHWNVVGVLRNRTVDLLSVFTILNPNA
jgi:hypothetical protein